LTQKVPSSKKLSTNASLFPGESLVGISTQARSSEPRIYTYDGELRKELPYNVIWNAEFIDDRLYLVSALDGVICLGTDDWRELTRLRMKQPKRITFSARSTDGKQIVLARRWVPDAIEFYDRNAETGDLTRTELFQPVDELLAEAREMAGDLPGSQFDVDPEAVRLPHLRGIAGMTFNGERNDSFFVYCKRALFAFSYKNGKWQHVDTVWDQNGKVIQNGLMGLAHCVTARENQIFVGATNCLAWYSFDGRELRKVQWWVDDSAGFQNQPRFPFLDRVFALAISANGRYLFLGAGPTEENPNADLSSIHVLEIGTRDLKPVGSIDAGGAGSHVVNVKLSPDGKHLCAQTTDCQLLIYDLDERFWK